MKHHVEAFVAKRWSLSPQSVRVDLEPLQGGLESPVALARVTTTAPDTTVPIGFVVKQLAAHHSREAQVYESLWRHIDQPPAPAAFGSERHGHAVYLYLEHVTPSTNWPWVDTRAAAAVCRELARLHDMAQVWEMPGGWDYEAELAASAESTLALGLTARDARGKRFWRRMGDLRRVVSLLPRMREILLSGGQTAIHGDVHPGNVVVRAKLPRQMMLIDWSRARSGSPLEDVASWLHSLGCWEPRARQRHDSLLRAYLDARRTPRRLEATLRRDYWYASASNGLAGAIRYHLCVAGDAGRPEEARQTSRRLIAEWERVIRRAAALLNTSRARYTAAPLPVCRSTSRPPFPLGDPGGPLPTVQANAPSPSPEPG